jgi:hypothetical protein
MPIAQQVRVWVDYVILTAIVSMAVQSPILRAQALNAHVQVDILMTQ